MKILGLKFHENLCWDLHFETVKKKAKIVFSKLKYLRRLIDPESMKRILTTHYFGMVYYASQVWLNELTTSLQWKLINSLHYKALRIVIGDFRNRTPRDDLNKLLKRATPSQWMLYSNAKIAITLFTDENGPQISQKIRNNAYLNNCKPGIATFMYSSRLKIGRNSLQNRVKMMMSVRFKWTTGINRHALRVALKSTFFKK